MTRWRGSFLSLGLSLTVSAHGIAYACLISQIDGFHPFMALYELPTLVGGMGVLIWLRSRKSK